MSKCQKWCVIVFMAVAYVSLWLTYMVLYRQDAAIVQLEAQVHSHIESQHRHPAAVRSDQQCGVRWSAPVLIPGGAI